MSNQELNQRDYIQTTDPTVLTTQQTLREVSALKELVFNRLESMAKAIEVAHADLVRVPTDVQNQVGHLKELHEEKFNSIEKQFKERDIRTEQTQRDSKVAVDAALQAAKEAVGEQNRSSALAIAKSEASTMKQIDQIGTLIQTGTKAVDDKFEDVKERLSKVESRFAKTEGQSTGRKDFYGWIVGGVGLLLTLLLLADKFKP